MSGLTKVVGGFLNHRIEDGGTFSTRSLLAITTFLGTYVACLMAGSVVFWRMCTGV